MLGSAVSKLDSIPLGEMDFPLVSKMLMPIVVGCDADMVR